MFPVLPLGPELPLLDAAQTRALEQSASVCLAPHALMRRAGEAVTRLTLALAPHARSVWIAAGPGNNGGDGLDAACHLHRAGKSVSVSLFGDRGRLPPDAADALARALAAGVDVTDRPSPEQSPGIAIDALLGVGASRAPEGAMAEAIRVLNALPCDVLAIDLPSGLDAVTGQALGTYCVTAANTLALLSLKPGLFTGAGRDRAGRVWFDALGVANGSGPPTAWLGGVGPAALRRHDQNKGSFGDVAVVAGAPGMTGAGLLAARAALAAGAGRIYLSLLDSSTFAPRLDALHPELMFRQDWAASPEDILGRTTVVCGCGGSDAVRAPMPRLMAHARRLVLDADALNALAAEPDLAAMLQARSARGQASVLTPHPLEAARLLGSQTTVVQGDRLAAAHALAARFACVVVLKGSGTVIAAPGEVARINSTGNAALATAGTGDVLSGWLGGRWAQIQGPDEWSIAFAAARSAVAEHGAAAEPQPPGSLRASDLIERLHAA